MSGTDERKRLEAEIRGLKEQIEDAHFESGSKGKKLKMLTLRKEHAELMLKNLDVKK